MRLRFPTVVALAGLWLLGAPAGAQPAPSNGALRPPAPAVASHSVDVMVVHATRAKTPLERPEIDPRIGDLPQLRQEPFSLYDRFSLLGRERLPLRKAEPRSLTLPNSRVLVTELMDVLPQDVFRVQSSITTAGGKELLARVEVKARRDKPFIVAGQSYDGGILVLVLRVVK